MPHPRENAKKVKLKITHSCEHYNSDQEIDIEIKSKNITRPPNKVIIHDDKWSLRKYLCFMCIKPKYEEYYKY